MDLWQEIEKKSKMLEKAIKELAENGYDKAEKEKNYKIAVSKKVFELKEAGTPATLINLVIYGIQEIAELREQRDLADAKYNANQEYINVMKLQIRILENQLNREYCNAK